MLYCKRNNEYYLLSSTPFFIRIPALLSLHHLAPIRYFHNSFFLIVILLFLSKFSVSQHRNDTLSFFSHSSQLNNNRLRGIILTGSAGYIATMAGLNELWYNRFPRSGFHFFNDNNEWLQVDKAGHVMTSYYVGKIGMDALKWSGLPAKKALWCGTLGLAFLSTVELFDGFSDQWGASPGDMAANAMGTAFLIAQESLWDEQRILLKFSFSPTEYAQHRPYTLGNNFQEQALKDYNGQTYWLSLNISSFLNNQTTFPRWLNAAFGYGANGMMGGTVNPITDNNGNPFPVFKRARQYYFSIDIDLTRLKTKPTCLHAFFNTFGFVKFPAPSIEYSGNKIKFHPLFF